MSLGVSYMGTKRHLVPDLSQIIASCRPGVFLDVFSGMCSVGRAVAPCRPVWSNDLQAFAQLVASTHFCSSETPISRYEAPGLVAARRATNADALRSEFAGLIRMEEAAVELADVDALASLFDASVDRAQAITCHHEGAQSYDLFSKRYGGTYFSYRQASEIDSIRCAIDALRDDKVIADDQWGALIVALCIAMSRCSNSTGHFAQALYPKIANIRKVIAKRRRNLLREWLNAIDDVLPLGSRSWRNTNMAFRKDAGTLLASLQEFKAKPSVIYADPPYTQDQYSRYYHIYETAVLYDHPSCHGRGLYRPDRATSPFSLASKVEQALDDLIASVARLKSCLVLSYPSEGLLKNSESVIPKMILSHFGVKPECLQLAHRHSTMGASKGATVHDVTEVIYRVVQ